MNFVKSELYSLSPDEYLQRFQTPHSIISNRGSAEQDAKDTEILDVFFKAFYNDTIQTRQARQKAVAELSEYVDRWMADVQRITQHKKIDFKQNGFGLKLFGSYKLRANSMDGDIDMICIVPEYFSRKTHFFGNLADLLRTHKSICEIFSIPDAMVPLIKLTLYGIQIDLLIARMPEDFLIQNPKFYEVEACLQKISFAECELRNINGYRTAFYFKQCVAKYPNFRVTLKAIKMWAKNKGIYSQIYGYLGGAAYSILLVKICQLYPKYSPLQLLDRFFFIYTTWVWTQPVIIEKCSFELLENAEIIIQTPLAPQMNAAHYVSKITFAIIKKQLKIAAKMIQEIKTGKQDWKNLFSPINFLDQYNHFIEISIMANKMDDFVPWRGNIQSKIRKFIKLLQPIFQVSRGIEVNLFPRQYSGHHPNYRFCSNYYIGLKCTSDSPVQDYREIDLSQATRTFLEILENYSDIEKAPKQINIKFTYLSKKGISAEVAEQMKGWTE